MGNQFAEFRGAALSRRTMLAFLGLTLSGAAAAAGDEQAPDSALTLAPDGRSSSIRKFRGKVLYVDFWASWCAPCLLSFPFMNQLQSSYAGRGLQVLAVNMDEKAENAQQFLARHAVNFDVALGSNGQVAKDFGVADMPSSFLVDRNGIVRARHSGFRADDAGPLRQLVEQLLA